MGDETRTKGRQTPAPPPDPEEWLTAVEAGRLLRLSRRPLYRALRSGAIPSVKFGNLYRVRRSDLASLAADNRTAGG